MKVCVCLVALGLLQFPILKVEEKIWNVRCILFFVDFLFSFEDDEDKDECPCNYYRTQIV